MGKKKLETAVEEECETKVEELKEKWKKRKKKLL